MRAWTLRHPNVMVLFWAFAVAFFAHSFVLRIGERRWGWAALAIVAMSSAMGRFSSWWKRT